MALPPFFDKAALAAAAVLQGFDRDRFAAALEAHAIGLAFDEAAVTSFEGRTTLRLTANLLARLYPCVSLLPHGSGASAFVDEIARLVLAVNPQASLVLPAMGDEPVAAPAPDVLLIVGMSPAAAFGPHCGPAIYIGSVGWEARIALTGPVGVGSTTLPFGAAAAACLGTANVFRWVFRDQLPGGALDTAVTVSTLSLTVRHEVGEPGMPLLDPEPLHMLGDVDLGEVVQVGAGAVGQGTLWTLAQVLGLHGTVHGVDGERLDATNPQRYLLAASSDTGELKVELAAELFGAASAPVSRAAASAALRSVPASERSALVFVPHPVRWGEFLAQRPAPWRLRRVLVAVDSARDRIAVQAALPAWVANAWTQPGDLGLSRHAGLGRTPCLACLYVPLRASAKHGDVLVAEALGLMDQQMAVRQLLATNAPVEAALLRLIADRLEVPIEDILRFAGRPLRSFYSEAICGGVVLRLQAKRAGRARTEVAPPSARDSACDTDATNDGIMRPASAEEGSVARQEAMSAPADVPSLSPGPDAVAAMTNPTENAPVQMPAKVPNGAILGRPRDHAAMVPMAFQSVLSGVLLAAAVVADAAGLPAPRPGRKAALNLLRPLPPHLLVPLAPHPSGKCLCQDADFQAGYAQQWGVTKEELVAAGGAS